MEKYKTEIEQGKRLIKQAINTNKSIIGDCENKRKKRLNTRDVKIKKKEISILQADLSEL